MLLDDVKLALRVTVSAYDPEITSLIGAGPAGRGYRLHGLG